MTDKHVLAELENIGRSSREIRKLWKELDEEKKDALRRLVFKAHKDIYQAALMIQEETKGE